MTIDELAKVAHDTYYSGAFYDVPKIHYPLWQKKQEFNKDVWRKVAMAVLRAKSDSETDAWLKIAKKMTDNLPLFKIADDDLAEAVYAHIEAFWEPADYIFRRMPNGTDRYKFQQALTVLRNAGRIEYEAGTYRRTQRKEASE